MENYIRPALKLVGTEVLEFAKIVFNKLPKLINKGLELCEKVFKPAWKVIDFAWTNAVYPYVAKPMLDGAIWATKKLMNHVIEPALDQIVKPLFNFTFVTVPTTVYHTVIAPVERAIMSAFRG